MNRGPKGPRDDFYCWKYQVWYGLTDCVFRHAWQTHPACAACEQGAGNLRLLGHVPELPRWAELPVVDDEPEAAAERPPRRRAAARPRRS